MDEATIDVDGLDEPAPLSCSFPADWPAIDTAAVSGWAVDGDDGMDAASRALIASLLTEDANFTHPSTYTASKSFFPSSTTTTNGTLPFSATATTTDTLPLSSTTTTTDTLPLSSTTTTLPVSATTTTTLPLSAPFTGTAIAVPDSALSVVGSTTVDVGAMVVVDSCWDVAMDALQHGIDPQRINAFLHRPELTEPLPSTSTSPFTISAPLTTSIPSSTSSSTSKTSHKAPRKGAAIHSPTFNTRWSSDEDALLLKGIEKFGFGHWALISTLLPTRTTVQCKNRGRHLRKVGRLQGACEEAERRKEFEAGLVSVAPSTPAAVVPSNKASTVIAQEREDEDEEEIDVVEVDTHVAPVVLTTPTEPVEGENDPSSFIGDIKYPKEDSTHPSPLPLPTPPISPHSTPLECQELLLPREQITPAEIQALPEWFLFLTSTPEELAKIHPRILYTKTPSRYLRIRNHVLDEWERIRPARLTKSRT